MRITRLAPSPTGALHLGNARTFLVNWLLARAGGWRIVLRIEDLDGPRVKKGADRQALDDLRWLGIDWDEGPVYQSARRPLYQQAVEQLLAAGRAYACLCTRTEVAQAASAPHADDGATVYPGTCRDRYASLEQAQAESGRAPAVRFRLPEDRLEFRDSFSGMHTYDLAGQLGDFVIAKADGTPAYQLAVVVDDAAMGVTDVVRGADLLDSTPRQLLLFDALGHVGRQPNYYHLPLVIGPDGRRLAKRHGDTRLAFYREQGVPAARVLELLARWCGLEPPPGLRTAGDLLSKFSLDKLPRTAIVCTPADDRWLRQR